MRISQFTVLSIATLTLAGCGSMSLENKSVDYQAAAIKVPSLEIPPDLTTPSAEDHFIIPDGSTATANYSDFASVNNPAQAQTSPVLPQSKNVHIEHNGTQRWLQVNDKAENLWPVIKAFWLENGFVIKVENPQAGILETDWAENRARIPQTGLRSILGKVIDGMYDSGQRDMYHVRLERGKDGNGTDIYLTQYGKEEVLSADKNITQWQSRPNDPELEATMLQMLMVKLGGPEMQGKLLTGGVPSPALSVAASLKTLPNGSKVILLNEPFDRSWRTVGLALDNEGIKVEDKDRASGVYFIRVEEKVKEEKSFLDKIAFWHKEESIKPARYQVTVHENKTGCEVAASNGKGENNSNSQQIIDMLLKAFGK